MIRRLYRSLFNERQRNSFRSYIRKLTAWKHYGDGFYCVFCDRSFKIFLSKGNVDKRSRAECPRCGSLERTRLLYYYLEDETDMFDKHLRVLHFAPEQSLKDILATLDLEYIDADINPHLASYVVDITSIDYPDNHFDLIICSHVLGHVPDETAALSELRRVLNPEGEIMILTWQGGHKETILRGEAEIMEYKRAFRNDETLQRLHGDIFIETLQASGFDVTKVDYRNHFTSEQRKRFALGDGRRELIFLCKKHTDLGSAKVTEN